MSRPNTIADFWASFDMEGPVPPHRPELGACWVWTKAIRTGGYGLWTWQRKSVSIHRFAWEMTHGPIPEGLNVLHRCDNPPCGRPTHLFLGTYQDNNEDMWAKGRGKADTHSPAHGTYPGYVKHVRQRKGEWSMPSCDPCREANAAYRRSRAAVSGEPKPDPDGGIGPETAVR